MMGLARNDWQRGATPSSIRYFLLAAQVTVADTLKRAIAYQYVARSEELFREGHLPEALDMCQVAVAIHDDEGAISYYCTLIDWELRGTPPAP